MKKHFKRLSNSKDFFIYLVEGMRSLTALIKAKKNKLIDDKFMEQIMLAVTQVNGCRICSYYHTKEAIKSGLTKEEVDMLLDGSFGNIDEDEQVALLFAQHYAEAKGKVDKATYEIFYNNYGKTKALGILGAIRMIMIGNTSGIAGGALKDRFKGKKVPNSKFINEFFITIGNVLYLPFAIIIAIFFNLFRVKLVRFAKG